MGRLIFTCTICLGFIIACNAQQHAIKPSFEDKVVLLMNDIDQKNTVGQNLAFTQLDTAMSSQILYLSTFISNMQAAYKNDTAKAGKDYRAAVADSIQAHNELVAAQGAYKDSNSTASIVARKKATSDMAAAHNVMIVAGLEMHNANNVENTIRRNESLLTIEQQAYNALQPLKGNLAANKASISSYLNQFAGTL